MKEQATVEYNRKDCCALSPTRNGKFAPVERNSQHGSTHSPLSSSMAAIAVEYASTDVGRVVEQAPSANPHMSTPPDAAVSLGEDTTAITSKKKKKKKPKKSAKSKNEPNSKPLTEDDEPGPLVLRISRNKHWRYISSYHVCPLPLTCLSSCITRENRARGFSSR